MDKYGVVLDEEIVKTAMDGANPCPQCGSRSVNHRSITPHCPNCGTEPWEKHGKKIRKDRRK